MNKSAKKNNASGLVLKPNQLHNFFINHLNRIHCAKAHLVERLPELAGQADFNDLKHAIEETHNDIDKQLARMDEMYALLKEKPSLFNCDDLISLIEDGFSAIYLQ